MSGASTPSCADGEAIVLDAGGRNRSRRMTGQESQILQSRIAEAVSRMSGWLRGLPEWPHHPTNATESVSAHFGPTILSEHDCVMHFARFLNQTGVPWEDMHLELSPGQWMFHATATKPKRIDLAVIPPGRLTGADLPVPPGDLELDAVFEFALASNYWRFGVGSPKALLEKVDQDVAKVAEYLRSGLAARGYVVVIEECDHSFPAAYADEALTERVEVLLLRQWRRD